MWLQVSLGSVGRDFLFEQVWGNAYDDVEWCRRGIENDYD